MQQSYKRPKKATVQLTSLLDLLFVMIFVSLLQQKAVDIKKDEKVPKKVTEKPIPAPAKPIKIVKKAPPRPVVTQYSINAIFHFHPTAQNPSLPTGSYKMRGDYNTKTGNISLGGTSWINRPQHYDMVPLSGKIDTSGSLFTGRVEFQGCKQFTLKKVNKSSGTPISGVWEGVYDCSQGATGLTLTIE